MKDQSIIKLSAPSTRDYWEIPVLYEDEQLLALCKPAKLLTSPDRYDPNRPNLMRLLHKAIEEQKPWAASRGLTYLMNVHRLDFETTGIILLVKSKPALVTLTNIFGSEKPVKKYVALAQGNPEAESWELDAPLAIHPLKIGLMRVDHKEGKRSITQFNVLERYKGYALIQCRPLTGRTHQIRVHLKHSRLPICGDSLYGGRPLYLSRLKPDYRLKADDEERPLIGSVALHAEKLEIPHPVTGNLVSITAEWPKDLKTAVKYLKRYSPW